MKHLYIIRHAQSIANSSHKVVGSIDSPLSDLGREQAKIAGRTIKKHFKIDAIYCSPLSRAQETAQIIAKNANINPGKISTLSNLRERNLGEMEGASYGQLINKQYDGNFEDVEKAKGLEPIKDFYARAKNVLNFISKQPQDNILLVCHNGIGRMLQTVVKNNKPLKLYTEPRMENAVVYKLKK
ncbi:MAG: histidine phosphatase family protein [Candidatus Woesebacteria bacterium]|jgi:broad specificity phosphatase PhoE